MWRTIYQSWADRTDLDPIVRTDLDNKSDIELEDMFYTSLAFGTGGLRGIVGAGTNRMNVYTVRRANEGLARYLENRYVPAALGRGVVIAYDNRNMSREFAEESAKVLGAHGIRAYLFDALRPTPELSFAVRDLSALAGIVVTASHNPPKYNGYKIYDEYGCQFTPVYADLIVGFVESVADPFSIATMDLSQMKRKGLLVSIGTDLDDRYLAQVKTVQIRPELERRLKLVFTPLHGTSAELGTRLLRETGYAFDVVPAQMIHDPFFGTVQSPNPENPGAFALAIAKGLEVDADILIATDPDADRLGVAVKDGEGYRLLTGNQTGALLLDYLLAGLKETGTLPAQGVVFNTIVTSDLGAKIARSYGFEVVSTLTGFKFIGEQARFLEGTNRTFVFGYEESYGYVIKDFVRDKDSLQALLLASEAANYWKLQGKSLVDRLAELFAVFGTHLEVLENLDLFGSEGAKRIDRIVAAFRLHPPVEIAGLRVKAREDYEASIRIEGRVRTRLTLPKANVMKFILDADAWFVLRPSGTEPKLKLYVGVVDRDPAAAQERLRAVSEELLARVNAID
ncbi:MAG TPA: phosphoglucomutase [Acholeplasmatales bacterium]|nr:phosphoglucomutase [Acholeplasmatales bacterium]